jgi:hypothetical protein
MDIWSYHTGRRLWDRLTFDPGDDILPLWSPDGSRIVFGSRRGSDMNLYWKLVSAPPGSEELLLSTSQIKFPMDWSADGRFLLVGDSGVGKSELGLELISRGHGLVADDVVEISRIAGTTLEGRCPPMLKDFLEVRGLGLLNIRTIFGETAVRPKMKLKLVAHLEGPHPDGRNPAERLPLADMSEEVLGVIVRRVVIPVAAGRNLAVLIEAAVRNHILQLRGVNSMDEFMARQKRELDGGKFDGGLIHGEPESDD